MSFLKKTGKAMADVIPGLGKFTFDPELGTVFITSGTGVIGYRVALSLLEAGHKSVRVGIWKGDRLEGEKSFGQQVADVLEAKGAEVVDFDWACEEDYDTAVRGVKTVFCSLPHMENWSDVFPAFLRACKKHKVEHFVKISFLRSGKVAERYREEVPFVRFHGTCDDILEQAKFDSRISYTILAASHLMSTPLVYQAKDLREKGRWVTASYGMGINYVSPNDVCDCALVVLLDRKKHRNKVYNLTGGCPIKDSDICKLLMVHYGKPIEHVQLGYHHFKKEVKGRGLPDWLVKDMAEFERMKASGVDEYVSSYTKDVEILTGRKPETFKDYLTNKSCMRPGLTFP